MPDILNATWYVRRSQLCIGGSIPKRAGNAFFAYLMESSTTAPENERRRSGAARGVTPAAVERQHIAVQAVGTIA